MEHETELAVAAAQAINARYDEACAELLKRKEIVAPILREVVPEYKDCTIDEVIACIETDNISSDPVDNVSAVIEGLPTEMKSVSEKLIRYDSHFKAVNPKLTTEVIQFFLYIDIEVQNDYKPSNPNYPVLKRAMYYAARELSAQLGILSETTDYGDLQKCYSIWICNEDIPKEYCNSVTSYAITKNDVIGKSEDNEQDYDLVQVIMIRRGNDEGRDAIFDYLTGLFKSDIERLSKYIDVDRKPELKEEVAKMSGLGASIASKNYDNGMLFGMQQGIQAEREKNIKAMINENVPLELVAKIFDISVEQVAAIAGGNS